MNNNNTITNNNNNNNDVNCYLLFIYRSTSTKPTTYTAQCSYYTLVKDEYNIGTKQMQANKTKSMV
jgi:hypothetical protein